MKIKIIDILNMIARGEEPPKKIVWKNKVYIYEDDDYYTEDEYDALLDYHEIVSILNDEVEILEITITPKEDFFKNLKELGVTEIYKEDNIENNKQDKIEKLDFDRNDITYCEGNLKTDEDMADIIIEIKDKINEIIDHIQE